jgi:uncharacterized protein (TIGR02231 family)
MKTYILTLTFAFGSLFSLAQKNPDIIIESKVNSVKFYLGGAQVLRSASFELTPGNTTIIFTDLPNTIDPSTFQVEGVGSFTIMSIKEGYNNKPKSLPKEVKQIKDSLTLLLSHKEDTETAQSVVDEEEKFLNQNRVIGGQQNGVKAIELKDAADFYRARLSEIKKTGLANRRKISKLNEEIERLKARLYPFSSERVSLNQELTISVTTEKAGRAKLKVSYFTAAAGWEPMYDIRSNGPGSPVNLVLKASANNATGENWENVHFTFSTGQPSANATPPTIYPWYIRPLPPPSPMVLGYSERSKKMSAAPMAKADDAYYELAEVAEVAGSMADYSQKQDAITSIDCSILTTFSLVTSKDPLIVEIEKQELQAEYEYFAIPKLVPKVYLMAKMLNIDRLNLLSANASIYLNNAYTSSAYIDPAMARDTLTLPLGQDNAISVTRIRIKDFKAKSFIGTRVTETIGWNITVRSLKQAPVKIKLTDQLPLTTDKTIKVDVVDVSNGRVNAESGLVNWDFNLDAGKSQTVKLVYKVEYPKDMKLVLE